MLHRGVGGEPVAQVEEPAHFILMQRIIEFHPTPHCPSVELTSADVDSPLEPPGEQISHGRLARPLRSGDKPDVGHAAQPAGGSAEASAADRDADHDAESISYTTSPCSVPGSGSSQVRCSVAI